MKKDTKILLMILGIILAWAILSGNLDLGFFSVTPSPSSISAGVSSSGSVIA